MDNFKVFHEPHRRYNPLTDEWVLVSPHRMRRPWHGQEEKAAPDRRPAYDPNCYLCPGNIRANGEKNPDYKHTFVFSNDYSALKPDTVFIESEHPSRLLRFEGVTGICKVICFSPRHNLTLSLMTPEEIEEVIGIWIDQMKELGKKYPWVQIFENKGEIMGCSNPHPHGQIWAGSFIPNEILREDRTQMNYYRRKESCLLLDYIEEEIKLRERIVVENRYWLAIVPFWAVWPFEILLVPFRHIARFTDLNNAEKKDLADILKRLLVKYDNLFQTSFPYTMGWHGAPFSSGDNSCWQLHAHFYPPLLRSSKVKKFMVGYEMLSEPQRDLTPEAATERLRACSELHYSLDNR